MIATTNKEIAAKRYAAKKARKRFVVCYTAIVVIITTIVAISATLCGIYATGHKIVPKEEAPNHTIKMTMTNVIETTDPNHTKPAKKVTNSVCMHKYIQTELVSATCTNPGLVRIYCPKCGQDILAPGTKTDHQWSVSIPSTVECGIISKCSTCGTEKSNEVSIPDYIWNRLINAGFTPAQSAGIIGNMMVECGGSTLDLNWSVYDQTGHFYGLCQWNNYYYPEVQGSSVPEQINFLLNNIEQEFVIGGSNISNFKQIQDPATAALEFARRYERCAEFSYSTRQSCAVSALEHFTK